MNTEKVSEEILSRPRLDTFEELIHCDDVITKENRTKLFEDFLGIKNELKLNGNGSSISDNMNDESDNSVCS